MITKKIACNKKYFWKNFVSTKFDINFALKIYKIFWDTFEIKKKFLVLLSKKLKVIHTIYRFGKCMISSFKQKFSFFMTTFCQNKKIFMAKMYENCKISFFIELVG